MTKKELECDLFLNTCTQTLKFCNEHPILTKLCYYYNQRHDILISAKVELWC